MKTSNHQHDWLLEECDCGADWKQYQDELKASKVANTIYIFDCVDCRQFYGEQSLTPDGRLLCPSCYSEQVIESAFVEAVLAKSEVKPFTAGILCEDCAEPIERDGYETYCYKCDPTFEMNQ